eukprot:CAMPEP_0197189642 /NCGR_PEP_ID=MMETSP1423-20130617/20154_1 /TAXON_ID=476441 /ORGANISM="Pseudo-nitzschia heimii, Strain UNC1101" /LENGTH=67 /DNA_ID=CAMNT_0042641811 /DNA_START=1 /DNA_END=200 /DNA_ORIENTATION=-
MRVPNGMKPPPLMIVSISVSVSSFSRLSRAPLARSAPVVCELVRHDGGGDGDGDGDSPRVGTDGAVV